MKTLLLVFASQLSLVFASPATQAPPRMKMESETKCRATAAFKKLCDECQADKVDNRPTCLADVPNHASSPEFLKLTKAMNEMVEACGYKVPANACIRGLGMQMAAICRGDRRMPDIQHMIEPGTCN